MAAAQFGDLAVEAVDSPLALPSAEECVRFERESFGALHRTLTGVPSHDRAGVWAEVEEGLRRYETGSGFIGPCELLVAEGSK